FGDPEADFYLLIKNFSALLLADQKQYERDHAEGTGKAKGPTEAQGNPPSNVAIEDAHLMYPRLLVEAARDTVEEKIQEILRQRLQEEGLPCGLVELPASETSTNEPDLQNPRE